MLADQNPIISATNRLRLVVASRMRLLAKRGSRSKCFDFGSALDFGRALRNKKSNRSGQSLVEVMIALSILTMGFLGVFNLLAKSLFLNRTVSNEATATYLAAEGVELAKNMIDHDVYLGLATGGAGWGACFGNGGDFELDHISQSCTFSLNRPLWYHAASGLYDYNQAGATKTAFTRKINVQNVGAPLGHEIEVKSTVSWNTGLASSKIAIEDYFYNWH